MEVTVLEQTYDTETRFYENPIVEFYTKAMPDIEAKERGSFTISWDDWSWTE